MDIIFGVGDGLSGDALELHNRLGAFRVEQFNAPRPRTGDKRRVIDLLVMIRGANQAVVENRLRALERMVNLVGAGTSAAGLASGVTLSIRGTQTNGYVYFDVLEAELSYPNNAFQMLFGYTMFVPLRLICVAEGRGDAITDEATALTAADPVLYRADIPGDCPALVEWEVVSTGLPINSVSIGHRSLAGLADGQFQGVYVASAVSPATDVAFADAIGGTIARRTSVTADTWSDLAVFTPPTPFNANAGTFDLLLRVRDSTALPGVPSNLSRQILTTGTLPNGSYQLRVTTLAGAVESLPSNITNATLSGGSFDAIRLTWSPGAGATGHRVYWKRDTQPWKWKNTGSASGLYDLLNESGATTSDPPSAADTIRNAQYRLLLSLPSGVTTLTLKPVEAAKGNSVWEWLLAGTEQLPPTVRAELGSTSGWRALVQVNPAQTSTQEVNVLALLPSEQQQVHARYRALDLASNRTLLFGSDRQERDYGLLLNGSTEAGALDVRGPSLAGPGDTQFVFIPLMAGNVATVTGVTFNVRPRFIPRYRGPFKGEA